MFLNFWDAGFLHCAFPLPIFHSKKNNYIADLYPRKNEYKVVLSDIYFKG